jgi:hypothetical protein
MVTAAAKSTGVAGVTSDGLASALFGDHIGLLSPACLGIAGLSRFPAYFATFTWLVNANLSRPQPLALEPQSHGALLHLAFTLCTK